MKIIVFIIVSCTWIPVSGQIMSLEQAIAQARKNNGALRTAAVETERQRQLRRTSVDLPKTDISLLYGQYNSHVENDNNISISQTIPFTAFGSQGALNRSLVESSELKEVSTEHELVYQVKQVYFTLAYLKARQALLHQQDSIYNGFLRSASLRFKAGETNRLEKAMAEAQAYEVQNLLKENEADIAVQKNRLAILINGAVHDIDENGLQEIPYGIAVDTASVSLHPSLQYLHQQVDVALNQRRVARARLAPDLTVGFFTQTLIGYQTVNGQEQYYGQDKRFEGFQVGISLPLWFAPHMARTKAAEYDRRAAQTRYAYSKQVLQGQLQQALQELVKNRNSLQYYKESALPNYDLILRHADLGFRNGEIGFAEYLVSVRDAIRIKANYLQAVNAYNQTIITIEFLSGNQTQSHDND